MGTKLLLSCGIGLLTTFLGVCSAYVTEEEFLPGVAVLDPFVPSLQLVVEGNILVFSFFRIWRVSDG